MHPETAIYDTTPLGASAGQADELLFELGGRLYIRCPWRSGALYPACEVVTPSGLRIVEAIGTTTWGGLFDEDTVRLVVLAQAEHVLA
jgi:hypothetical protein